MVGQPGQTERGLFCERSPDDYRALPDQLIANAACDCLDEFSTSDEPFFLAIGFLKPHLPFVAPKQCWKRYPIDEMLLPSSFRMSPNVSGAALTGWGELRKYAGIPRSGQLDDETAREVIAGYKACITFVDEEIGRVLDQLEQLELSENTIVVMIGDHGWSLGEHGLWSKHTCFETCMRTPLMIRSPKRLGHRRGVLSQSLVEFVDIYPTLCELTEITPPRHLQGMSLAPVLKAPEMPHREVAYGRFGTGDTIRTDRYRFSEFHDDSSGELRGRMLYDHKSDPDETINLTDDSRFSDVVNELSLKLRSEMDRSQQYAQ